MTLQSTRRTQRLLAIVTTTIALGLVTGCDAQTDPAVPIRDFVLDFARSALAAFLL